METNITPTSCCPVFEPSVWDGKVLTWDNKRFIKGHVRTLWYIPLNFGSVVKHLMKAID